jgi:hypothetical protein
VDTIVKQHSLELLHSVRQYRAQNLTVQLFGVLLSSSTYDTLDVRNFLEWRVTLATYVMHRQYQGTFASFVEVRAIPALLRKCLQCAPVGLKQRVRRALPIWCNAHGEFPEVVADPNFYAPPFMSQNPYVGNTRGPTQPDVEQIFAAHGSDGRVADVAQLLALLLLNSKQHRLCEMEANRKSPSRGARTTSPSSSILSPTLATSAKRRRPIPRPFQPGQRPRKVADVALSSLDYDGLRQTAEAEDVVLPTTHADEVPTTPSLKRVATMPLRGRSQSMKANDESVTLPPGTSLAEVEASVANELDILESKLARVVNSFVRNRAK